MFFISSKKLFSLLRYSNFCNLFPSFPQFPDSKGQMEVEKFMISSTDVHKFADAIFGITQKLSFITLSNLVRPLLFLIFCPLKGTGFERKNKVNFFKTF